MITGDKCQKYVGTMLFTDEKNLLKAVINMDKGKSPGYFKTTPTDIFKGQLYKVKRGTKFRRYKKLNDVKNREQKMKDVHQKIADINGSWLENLKIGGKEYWNINNGILP